METPEQYTDQESEIINLAIITHSPENMKALMEKYALLKTMNLKNEIAEIKMAKDQIARDKRDLEKKHENLKEVLKESGERHKAKLMSVYYLLGSIRKMGTHHEKHVAVGYLQATVDDLVKHDNLSWNQDLFEIPF